MAIEEGQGSRNMNVGVSGYDLFVFPQFYVALFLFVLVALSCRFRNCVISISVGLFCCCARYLLSVPAMFKFCVYDSVLQFCCFTSICFSVSVHLFIYFNTYIMFGAVTNSYIPCHALMFDMLYGSCLHGIIMIDVMSIFINNIIYVIIIFLIYGIKMTWKLPNILIVATLGDLVGQTCRFLETSSSTSTISG